MNGKDAVPFYDFGRRLSLERGLIHESVEAALDSGSLILGTSVDAFEEEFAEFCGVSGAVAVGNGTDALELAIRSLMPAGGSAVVTVANAGGYSSLAAARSGYRAVYWEVDSQSLVMDLTSLTNSLDSLAEEGCGVVVFTHLYGSATDLSELRKRCDLAGVRLVEDCAQAAGSYSAAGPVGGAGHIGTFSFYPSKNFGAIGDAGAVVSRDSELMSRVRMLRQYGWREKYNVINEGGINSRMDSLQAEYLRRKLGGVAEVAKRRLAILNAYKEAAPAIRFVSSSDPGNVAHLAVLRTANRIGMSDFLNSLGIETAVHYPVPDYLQKGLEQRISLPITEEACNSVLSLPCNEFMSDAEVEVVCHALAEWGKDVDDRNE